MEERFTYIPLTIENILSFADYIPQAVQHRILRSNVTGWGVIEGDVVSGVGMVELLKGSDAVRTEGIDDDQLRILWIYVDEEVRGQGIGKELIAKCRAYAEENGAMGMFCRYPGDDFGSVDEFLISHGFSVSSDGGEETAEALLNKGADAAPPIHTAWLRLKGKARTADRQLLERSPEMPVVMPRLMSIAGYLEDMGYDNLRIDVDEHAKTVLVVVREDDLSDMAITVFADPDGNMESYTIMVQGERPFREKPEETAQFLEQWLRTRPMIQADLMEEDAVVRFTAMIPVDKGAVDEERFAEFFTAVCEEIDLFA